MVNTNSQHVNQAVMCLIAHYKVKAKCCPKSELNVTESESVLENSWDRQLVEFIRFGFPLDFNRNVSLSSEMKNHSSAVQYP